MYTNMHILTYAHTHRHRLLHINRRSQTPSPLLSVLLVSERLSVHSMTKIAFFCPYLTGIFASGSKNLLSLSLSSSLAHSPL